MTERLAYWIYYALFVATLAAATAALVGVAGACAVIPVVEETGL